MYRLPRSDLGSKHVLIQYPFYVHFVDSESQDLEVITIHSTLTTYPTSLAYASSYYLCVCVCAQGRNNLSDHQAALGGSDHSDQMLFMSMPSGMAFPLPVSAKEYNTVR